MWVIVVVLNGLTFVTAGTPFNSAEACHLAAQTAHVGKCIEIKPQQPKEGG
jgi:hypothetical protein